MENRTVAAIGIMGILLAAAFGIWFASRVPQSPNEAPVAVQDPSVDLPLPAAPSAPAPVHLDGKG